MLEIKKKTRKLHLKNWTTKGKKHTKLSKHILIVKLTKVLPFSPYKTR